MNSKLVSIIIPTYKRPNMLKRAIESVLNQSYPFIEVIVIDDNDEESIYRTETEVLMEQYKENERVIYVKHKKNKNGAAARNTGIKISRGSFIGFLDNDDEFLVNKISYQVNALKDSPEYIGGVYCSFNVKKDNQLQKINNYKKEGNLQFDVLCNKLNISGSNILFKKSSIERTGYYDESFIRHQDIEYLVRFFEEYEVKYIDKILLNLNKDDRSNNPDTENMAKVKEKFLEKYSAIISNYGRLSKEIYYYSYIEIFKRLLKEKKFKEAFAYWKIKKMGIKAGIIFLTSIIK